MNTDCFYSIGHSHKVCEDYALSGTIGDTLAYAVVCDGCSSSKQVDVGARLLAHNTVVELEAWWKDKEGQQLLFEDASPLTTVLARTIIDRACESSASIRFFSHSMHI